jgi:hypothetical protein
VRLVRSLLLALLVALLVGLAVGTWLRLRLESAPVYIGGVPGSDEAPPLRARR